MNVRGVRSDGLFRYIEISRSSLLNGFLMKWRFEETFNLDL